MGATTKSHQTKQKRYQRRARNRPTETGVDTTKTKNVTARGGAAAKVAAEVEVGIVKTENTRRSDHETAITTMPIGNQNLVRGLVRPVLGGIEDMSDRPEVRNVAKEKLLPLAYGFRREQPSSRGHERIFNVDIQFVVEA